VIVQRPVKRILPSPMTAAESDATLERLLRDVPYLRDLDRVSFARLVGALEEVTFPAGALIAAEGASADALYLLEEGSIRLTLARDGDEVEVADMTGPAYFGEMGLLLQRRSASIRASTDVRLWRIPRERFEGLVRERPDIGLSVARVLADLLDRRQRSLIGAPLIAVERPEPAAEQRARRVGARARLVRAATAFALPAVLWWLPPIDGLDVTAWRVLAILAGAALAWLLEPVPDFVVALAMAAAWGVLGLAPLATVLSGFASSSWMLALGALGLAAAMLRSGLLFRAAILALKILPATHAGQILALVLGGFVVTPLVPLSVARVAAIAPLSAELAASLGHRARSNGSAALAFAGLAGYWYFSNYFLTGFATNFFVFALLPAAQQQRFGWLGWFAAAAPAAIVSLVLVVGALFWLFPAERSARVSRQTLSRQQRILGPLSSAEWIALGALLILIVGLAIQPIFGVDPAWFALLGLVVVSGTVLAREQFRSSIDWSFLVFLGILLGSGAVLQRVGVDRFIAGLLVPIGAAVASPFAIVVLLTLATIALRFVLPSRPAMILLGLALVPSASALGVDPWVAGFIVLCAANLWILPYQGLEYLILKDATRGEAFDDTQGTRFAVALAAIRVIAIMASVPFWTAAGLLHA
jgi:divalent anion:Na+ symporter, DASS family